MSENLDNFLNQVSVAAEQSTLVKMTLSKPAQKHDELRNVYVKPVLIKEKRLLAFTYHYERRDEVKNYDVTQMLDLLKGMLPMSLCWCQAKARRQSRPRRCRNVVSRTWSTTNRKPDSSIRQILGGINLA